MANWLRKNALVGILLLVALLILLIPVFTWQSWHACPDVTNPRLVFSAVMTNAVGQRTSQGAVLGGGQYRAAGYKVIVYAKDDIWYSGLYGQAQKPAETTLQSDCSWQITGLHPGKLYVAYLVHPDFAYPSTVAAIDEKTLPLLIANNDQIVTVDWWQDRETAVATTEVEQATLWLQQQRVPNQAIPNPLAIHTGLLLSYADIPQNNDAFPILFARAYTPDNALGSMALLMGNNPLAARQVLATLQSKVEADGQINFYFDTDKELFQPIYRTDAIAWIGYAFVYYQLKTQDNEFQSTAEKLGQQLLSLQELDEDSLAYGALRRNQDATAVNHYATDNIMAYFFLRDLAEVTHQSAFATAASLVKNSLLDQYWNQERGYFQTNLEGTGDDFVEAQTLGAIFLTAVNETDKASTITQYIETTYQPGGNAKDYAGFAPFPKLETTWAQGSLQMSLAYQRLRDIEKGAKLYQQQSLWLQEAGGIPYAYPEALDTPSGPYHNWPSMAGTAWFIFAIENDPLFLRQTPN